jgi:tetratricopeptide (TPR) repeat protein
VPSSQELAEAEELLRLAIAEPTTAAVRARELATVTTDPWMLSVAGHARGVVLRDQGRTEEAVRELRAAVQLARLSGDPDRLADVRATLGNSLAFDGRTRSGLRELDRSVVEAVGVRVRARCLTRRGLVLTEVLGRHRDALADLRGALRGARSSGDRLWEARTLVSMSLVHLAVGEVDRAERALEEARRILEAEGQELEAAQAVHDQGYVAFCRGDLPRALRLYDRAQGSYAGRGEVRVEIEMAQDRCQALLAAGLPDEARAELADLLERDGIDPVHRADLLLYLAIAELARGDADAAVAAARAARDGFRRQGRGLSAARAELADLSARRRLGGRSNALAGTAADLARQLETARSEDAPLAWLLAGRAATDVGDDAAALWAAAARYRRHPSGLVRATAWLAEALDRDGQADVRGVWHACRRGLDALDDHRATLGSTELRALASVRGDELARLALSQAVDSRPRTQLWWSERWRGALAQPATRSPRDRELAGLLAALRANDRRLSEARDEVDSTSMLERERARLEKAIQHRRRLVAGSADVAVRGGLEVGRLVDEVGDATFVELFEVDGRLRSVVVTGGRVRAYEVGSAADAGAAVDSARFVLRQAARGRPVRLADVGARLQKALLGPSVAAFGSGPVVVSPTASLHATPWGLLPALADVPVTVVPTASAWLRARRSRARRSGRVLVVGPGLASGGAEVPRVAANHPEAVVLSDGSATVEACLRAMDGVALVHVAAHGRFRADNPMFSALELDDGPLTVHDFERLRRAPHRFVLSACDSGVLVPVGANELLGLATALMSIGTAGILSSVAPVNDEATAELMVEVHRGLDEVDDLGIVMQRVRELARGDVVREATAAAFVGLGV